MAMWLGRVALGVLVLVLLGLQALRLADGRADRGSAAALRRTPASPPAFDPQQVADLPDPARRYFLYAIRPGAPLRQVAELEMEGELSLGSKARPDYLPMRGRQVLRLDGFVWRVRAGTPAMWFSGSDGYVNRQGWTRFWLYGLLPIVRAGGGEDFARSAAGRAVAESAFWAPAALLPSPRVRWEPVDADTARAVVTLHGHEHRVELTVGPDGRPASVMVMRWSRENPERTWRLQPFGGTIGAVREVDGYRVAAEVEGGNGFGTPDYFPFYRARVVSIRLH
ncbi:DUF6544 family protein [Phenylobacterium sp.]|uniref:DUF6544 family protein n=1 Tax=Phenylobacterium sp. TaxID=1871053 RepID=UPI002B516CFB|nr:DUF6544 family protein [Phenylobacterium sp.]HVI32411.1 DUF6544 family protein [Phenylobacterium sp.]